jgi:hypothetical protein
MLYINSCVEWPDLEESLVICGATDRLTSLAINSRSIDFRKPGIDSTVTRLRRFKDLELLFVVVNEVKLQEVGVSGDQWALEFRGMDPSSLNMRREIALNQLEDFLRVEAWVLTQTVKSH